MSLDIFAQATDKVAEVKGVEHEWRGATVIVARANNESYNKYIAKEYSKCRAAIDGPNRAHADKVAQDINREAFVRHILVGWKDFKDQEGNEFPYNLKNARLVCDKVPDLVRDVAVLAANSAHYRTDNLKKDAEALKK